MEGAIEPSSYKSADQNRHNDRPSEPPHHRERATHRPFSGSQPMLATALRPLNGLFEFVLLGPPVIALLLLGCHDRSSRLFQRLAFELSLGGPQVTIDLPNRGLFQAERSRTGGTFSLDVLRHRGENLAAQMP